MPKQELELLRLKREETEKPGLEENAESENSRSRVSDPTGKKLCPHAEKRAGL